MRSVRQDGTEFISVKDHAAFVFVFLQAAGDHFHRHTDGDRFISQVGQLCGDHRAFFQIHQRDGLRCAFAEHGRCFIDRRVGIDLPLSAELILCLRFQTADRADIPGREDLRAAMRADFSGEAVALFF